MSLYSLTAGGDPPTQLTQEVTVPFSPANQERIEILRPRAAYGPDYNRGVREALDYAERGARWGDCACIYLVEAEVCAGLRPRDDLGRARADQVIPDDLCGCDRK
jgi:hypothetical protein